MKTKGTPKRDGSGKGSRKNQGRGGCKPTRKTGKGRSRAFEHLVVNSGVTMDECLDAFRTLTKM